jgi:hypothetical protein
VREAAEEESELAPTMVGVGELLETMTGVEMLAVMVALVPTSTIGTACADDQESRSTV